MIKTTYFLLPLHTFVYITKTANIAINSDILGFLVVYFISHGEYCL